MKSRIDKKHGDKSHISNLELFVKYEIKRINQKSLAENFLNMMQIPNKRKVSMRVDSDVFNFYHSVGKGYQTAMNAALRAVKEAIEAGKMKLAR